MCDGLQVKWRRCWAVGSPSRTTSGSGRRSGAQVNALLPSASRCTLSPSPGHGACNRRYVFSPCDGLHAHRDACKGYGPGSTVRRRSPSASPGRAAGPYPQPGRRETPSRRRLRGSPPRGDAPLWAYHAPTMLSSATVTTTTSTHTQARTCGSTVQALSISSPMPASRSTLPNGSSAISDPSQLQRSAKPSNGDADAWTPLSPVFGSASRPSSFHVEWRVPAGECTSSRSRPIYATTLQRQECLNDLY